MKQWVIVWSNDGIHFSMENIKILSDYNIAEWFAKTMENEYNYVRMYEASDGFAYQ
jgi:hypothetical protein